MGEADGARLRICAGEACRPPGQDWLRELVEAGCALEESACQGPCESAPVATLEIGGRGVMLVGLDAPAARSAALDFARRAARAGTLLVDPGAAQALRFDSVHGGHASRALLDRLGFLLGHFRGEGHYARRPGSFRKELVATLEAGGHFVALRMAVVYPLPDGREDVHEALVLVGAAGDTAFRARAYGDGGHERAFDVEPHGRGIRFADVPPGHGEATERARKTIEPAPGGLRETLEVEGEGGSYEPWSTLELRRVGASGASDKDLT